MAGTSVRQLHVLVLGEADDIEHLLAGSADQIRIERVSSFDEALEALSATPFDVVVARLADFTPLHGVPLSHHAKAIIDNISHGLCIVGPAGEMDWANPKLLSFPEDVRDRVCRYCVETLQWAQRQMESGKSELHGRRFAFTTAANERYEVNATPIMDLQNRMTQVAGVVWDATNAARLQEKIDAIDEAGRELLSLDTGQFSRLDTQERLSLLEQKILRCTRDLLHFDNFEIRVIDRKTNRLDLVLYSGTPAEPANLELYASTDGNGICGYVAARGRSYICPDTERDPRYIPGIENARSSLTVPLWLHNQVVGVANFESTNPAAFTEDDRQFAEIFGRYIALSLHLLELLASERRTTTGQLGSNVLAQITAPLNDILTDVESLVEDYIGHDDLRHRLRAISENAVRVRDIVKEVTSPRGGMVGRHAQREAQKDPLLAAKHILVADDEAVLRETVRDVLSGYGCLVTTAEDGADAIAKIGEQPFDLVLSDIKMPRQSGYDVFAAAKEANPDTPVILTTGFGYDPNHSIVRARREGLSAVLFKPFKVDQLLNEIRSALGTARG